MKKAPAYLGFFLIEQLWVLVIVCFFMGLPVYTLYSYQLHIKSQLFYSTWSHLIDEAQYRAILNKKKVTMVYQADEKHFSLYQGKQKIRHIAVPEHISVIRFETLTYLPKSGHISKVRRIIFKERPSDKQRIYQVYLGSGRMKRVS